MFLTTGNQAILSLVTSWTHVAIRYNMCFFSVQRCFQTVKMTKNVLIKGHFVKTVFFCKMVQFLVCYPCAATREINCFCCTQPRGKRMNMMQIRLNHRHGKNAHHFCEGCFFYITKTFFSLESDFTTMHKLGKVTKGSIKCHSSFLGQLLALYMGQAALFYV